MSFIPGEGSETLTIASQAGSGIGITAVSDVNYLSANLIAGANITLVPSVSNTSITISSSGAGGGISSVSSGAGSGIEATTVGAGVNLTSALVAGTGIQLVASGINKNLTINNTQSITTATGSGITATTVGGSTALVANLTAGNGITITPSVANTSKMISNAGLLGLSATNAGTNITITGTPTVPIINASGALGVASVSAGAPYITITGTATNPIVNNNGVRTITAGTAIQLSGTANDVIINATNPAKRPVRNLTSFNFTYSGSPIVLDNSTLTPANVGSILLASPYGTCFNFTNYIGSLETTASTTHGSNLNYIVYPATSPTQLYNGDDAMSSTICVATAGAPVQIGQTNQIWNWNGSLTGNLLYINVAPLSITPATTTTIDFVDIVFDMVGMVVETV